MAEVDTVQRNIGADSEMLKCFWWRALLEWVDFFKVTIETAIQGSNITG